MKDTIMRQAALVVPAPLLPILAAVVSSTAILVFAPVTMMFLTWFERKIVARFQDRLGPNRVGPFGLLQPIADGIKMILKEDIIPVGADRWVHHLTPVLAVVPVLALFLVLPFGRGMVAADLNVGVLFFLGVSGVQTPLVIAAGWGSHSKFSVLGSMRAAAQILSYELPMVLVIVAVVMASGSMSTSAIVDAQASGWYVLTPWGAAGALIFLLAATAESNRTPFDMAEAESELVAGFHTEYTGFKFALFQMAEFLSAFAAGGLAVTVFFGGWHGPAFLPSWAWFVLKMYAVFFVLVWFRATLPRFRIDQLLAVAWKFLFPMSLLVIASAAAWTVLDRVPALIVSLVLLLGGWWLGSAVL
ncbi:MAG: NADH-quinone oxidoreductase subunit NuoH, partial [bacterium]